MMPAERPGSASWADHLAAAMEMGLDVQTAYDTFDGGHRALVNACRERRAAMAAMLDDREKRGES